MGSKDLTNARKAKQDEFYTQLTDIEKELCHYTEHFKDKVVLCNCDDPRVSNFFFYFAHNFHKLGLKKLITTCYKSQDDWIFSQNKDKFGLWLEYNGELDENGCLPDVSKIGVRPFKKSDGDFRSDECIELLKQADVVVTNPPFSLFREYVGQLIDYGKKFLIIGNVNAVTYKEIFPLIKENKLWLGVSIHSGDREFGVPDDYPLEAASCRIDENGKKFIRVKGVRWFTNLTHKKRNEEIILYCKYNADDYPKYDNYDAIEVGEVKIIPEDFDGVMGVPITFLDKYCPEQFEIVGIAKRGAGDPKLKSKVYTKSDYPNYSDLNATPTLFDEYGKLYNTYPRILIRRKHHENN